jgi:hypothetical protein
MPHTRKKNKKIAPKKYTPIERGHSKIEDVVNAIFCCIKTNWMTEYEFEEIYKQIKEKLKND